jgi:hypothetical protein
MIFRAIFWIGLVWLLLPHAPDLGPGRPGAGASLTSPVMSSSANGISRLQGPCRDPACAGALAVATHIGLAPLSGRTLEDVKADIEADIKARKTAS